MIDKILSKLYADVTGHSPTEIVRLPGAGSDREYYRIGEEPTLIGTCGANTLENKAFVYLARHFYSKGLRVPEVMGVSDDYRCYIQSDLGNVSLFDLIGPGREKGEWTPEITRLLTSTITSLPDIQWRGAEGLDFHRCFPVKEMDSRSVMWDLNYFKYCFLKASGIDFDEPGLEDDFVELSQKLLSISTGDTFMYRDFQSRNVMVKDGTPYFIDFQGGRRGPAHYDVVSFLWQAKASIPERLRESLIDSYLESAERYRHFDRSAFRDELRYFVLFRTLQVLGAYGFRGLIERKPHFLSSIPKAFDNLRELLRNPFPEYPTLTATLTRLASSPQFMPAESERRLTIRVASFGYKRHGIPADMSGNGGGFVFDCRGLNNPGRHDRYKPLTGRDAEVIEFLENDGKIIDFLNHAYALVDNSAANYIERGFTDLSVSFGCTGGRHRSVYSADHMAAHLAEKFPTAKIVLTHIEQGIEETFNA